MAPTKSTLKLQEKLLLAFTKAGITDPIKTAMSFLAQIPREDYNKAVSYMNKEKHMSEVIASLDWEDMVEGKEFWKNISNLLMGNED